MNSHRTGYLRLLIWPLLVGCADLRDLPAQTRSVTHTERHADDRPQQYEQVRTAATVMLEGIGLYDNGDYQKAISKLSELVSQEVPLAIRVEALKYIAFSYCVMERYPECRHAFDSALKIDADFELGPSEGGHPMWGPIFEQAKVASKTDRAPASIDRESERWRGIDTWRAR